MTTQTKEGARAYTLESLVDEVSLTCVLELLGDVCFAKAQHLDEAWQDRSGAIHWERAGNAMFRASGTMAVNKVSGEPDCWDDDGELRQE